MTIFVFAIDPPRAIVTGRAPWWQIWRWARTEVARGIPAGSSCLWYLPGGRRCDRATSDALDDALAVAVARREVVR